MAEQGNIIFFRLFSIISKKLLAICINLPCLVKKIVALPCKIDLTIFWFGACISYNVSEFNSIVYKQIRASRQLMHLSKINPSSHIVNSMVNSNFQSFGLHPLRSCLHEKWSFVILPEQNYRTSLITEKVADKKVSKVF